MPSLDRYTIWHSTFQHSNYVPMLNRKIKVILTIHDLNFIYDPSFSKEKKERVLRGLQALINRANLVVCISEYCRTDVENYCRVQGKPLVVIHNGTNYLDKPQLQQSSYRPKKSFLFTIGVIARKKNLHALLPLLQMNKDLELVIAGTPEDPDYQREIISLAGGMNVQDSIHLVGAVSEAEKSWYFHHCKAFVFPSISEGFGLPITEAMSVGKPLFISDKTALPEIGSDMAFYFHDFSGEKMQQTFTEGMRFYEKENMQQAIMQRGEEFSWKRAAAEYLNVYRKLY
jgi:glycosyltransferase involved in cell wall biosynthesis